MQPFIALGITLALVRNTTRPYFAIHRQDGRVRGVGKRILKYSKFRVTIKEWEAW